MALAAVLSAMRTLILDAPELPEAESDRLRTFRSMFPDLSEEERVDLAKMRPARLGVYTRSIFIGEADLISTYQSMAVALLARSYRQQERRFGLVEFMRLVHKHHPWKTATTEGLIENFALALADSAIEVGPERQLAIDAARFERGLFYARRLPAGSHHPRESLELADLGEMTVGEILQLRWWPPQSTRLDVFSHDWGKAYRLFRQNDKRLPEVIDERALRVAFGRDRENTPRWQEVPPTLFQYLQGNLGSGGDLHGFAQSVLEDLAPQISEEEGFRAFLDYLRLLLDCGVMVVPRAL